MRRHAPTHCHPCEAGFSLFEVLVSLFVTATILVAALSLFDFNNRVTRVETQVAEMQQSLRVSQQESVRLVRMIGRGGLPSADPTRKPWPTGISLEVQNNVSSGTQLGSGASAPTVRANTDVLTVRGVFSAPMYQINYTDPSLFTLTPPPPSAPTEGTIVIINRSPTGVLQSLSPFKDAVDAGRREAILLVSPIDDTQYAIVELDPAASTVAADQSSATLAFKVSGGTNTASYLQMSTGGAFPATLSTVAFVSILEEYRIFIQESTDQVDRFQNPVPRLVRGRFFPNTNSLHTASDSLADVADYIVDFQVALGIDLNDDGIVADLDSNADEYLFNATGDNAGDAAWQTNPSPPLFHLRLTTLARTNNPDPGYRDRPITKLEDHVYNESEVPGSETARRERTYRRRSVTTTVDLRNLS